MSGDILVLIRTPDEVEIARALVAGLPDLAFRLLFGAEDLRTRFGPTERPTSVDLGRLFLEAHELRLALCFSSGHELAGSSNLLWLSFLNELGVPTVEIQRDVLQDTAAAARESSARHYLPWGGQGGIGDLRALVAPAPSWQLRDDVVAISSSLAAGAYSEEERFRFVFALMRLARENPEHLFLWRPAPSETTGADSAFWEVLEKLGPKNLVVVEHEPLAQLLARARFVIGMASTPLLDAAAAHKPGLVFVADEPSPAPGVTGRSFRSYAELRELWGALRRAPQDFVLRSALPVCSPEALAQHLEALALPVPSRDRAAIMPVALRYLAHYQDTRSRADLSKISGTLGTLDKRLTSHSEKVQEQLAKIIERVGVLQRSSVAYKALKLLGRVRKGGAAG